MKRVKMGSGLTENKGERRSDSKGGKIWPEDGRKTEERRAEKRTEREEDRRKGGELRQNEVMESRSRGEREAEEPEDSVDRDESRSGYVGEKTSRPCNGDRGEDVKEPEKNQELGDDEGLGEEIQRSQGRERSGQERTPQDGKLEEDLKLSDGEDSDDDADGRRGLSEAVGVLENDVTERVHPWQGERWGKERSIRRQMMAKKKITEIRRETEEQSDNNGNIICRQGTQGGIDAEGKEPRAEKETTFKEPSEATGQRLENLRMRADRKRALKSRVMIMKARMEEQERRRGTEAKQLKNGEIEMTGTPHRKQGGENEKDEEMHEPGDDRTPSDGNRETEVNSESGKRMRNQDDGETETMETTHEEQGDGNEEGEEMGEPGDRRDTGNGDRTPSEEAETSSEGGRRAVNRDEDRRWECSTCGQRFARRIELRDHRRHCGTRRQRAGRDEQVNTNRNEEGEPDVEMEDISGGAATDRNTRWGQIRGSNDRETSQRWGSDGGREATTRRHDYDRERITRGDIPRRREPLPGIRRWDAPEPVEMAEEPESRVDGSEAGMAWQDSDEPGQEERERGQITTIGSPDEEVNQGKKGPDSESEEGGGTF